MDAPERIQALVDPGLRAAVDTLSGPIRRPVGYHLGWWDQDGVVRERAGGKRIRAALVMLSAEAVGTAMKEALPAAVAVELTHQFSLLHDDVIDEDELRRNRPTVWTIFGMPAAILAGDALLVLAFQVLLDSESPMARTATRRLQEATQEMAVGQDADIRFERRTDVGIEECEAMAAAKTGALIDCACGLGALFGGAEESSIRRLRSFGRHMGMAFQWVDDALGLWGETDVAGKSRLSDARRHKKTLPIVAALAAGNAASRELAKFYQRDPKHLGDEELERVAILVEEAGGRRWAEREMERHFDAALSDIDTPEITSDGLISIATSIIKRDR